MGGLFLQGSSLRQRGKRPSKNGSRVAQAVAAEIVGLTEEGQVAVVSVSMTELAGMSQEVARRIKPQRS